MTTIVQIPEKRIVGKRLGRHVEHDPASRQYAHAHTGAQLVSRLWTRHAPIFDQGELGKCTCEAATGCAMTEPIYVPGRSLGDEDATKLYSVATRIDRIPGVWPPNDTGSTGLAAAKAAKREGWFGSYAHAFSTTAALDALAHVGPIMVGIEWLEGFDRPDPVTGEIKAAGSVRGGHEIEFREIDVENRRVWFDQSWGLSYGLSGRAWMSFDTFEQALSRQGDAVIPRGVTTP